MDDETRPIEPDAPLPPPAAGAGRGADGSRADAAGPQQPAQPAYAMPLPARLPAYAAQQRPRFADQVLGMRAVVAVALACLIIGGLSGFILGHAAGSSDGGRFGRGHGFFQQRGTFPGNGMPNGSNALPRQAPPTQ